MKKYFLLFLLAIFALSCSKKIEVTGKITGGSPLERIEFVEASGVATLPIANFGTDKEGNFSGSFDAPKSGMYVINYAGKQNLFFLKQGQKLEISGNGAVFPQEFVIAGDAKNDNEFFAACQKYLSTFGTKINMQQIMNGDENNFIKEMKKIEADLNKNIEQNATKFDASKEVKAWKTMDVQVSILNLMAGYEANKKQATANPNYKSSKAFIDYENSLQPDKEKMVETSPFYRQYLLTKLSAGFDKFAKSKGTTNLSVSEMFSNFLKTDKELSQNAKDYLLGYVIAQSDVMPDTPPATTDKVKKIIDTEIKNESIKKDIKNLLFAINGFKKGDDAPEAPLTKEDGSSYSLSSNKNKPYVLFFYTSWSPYISENTIPVLKDVVKFYGGKVNFVLVNLDDTEEQAIKTSKALLKDINGAKVYAKDGLNSDMAHKYGIYGFKLPSFIIVDKNGKIASRPYNNLGDPEFVQQLDAQSGMKAPKVSTPVAPMAPPPPPPAK